MLLHDNRLEMQKVVLPVSGDEAPPFLLRRSVVLKLSDKAFFKGIGLVGGVHGIDGDPPVQVAGELLYEYLHDPLVNKRAGHDLLDEYIFGQCMEYPGAKLIADIFHCGVDMPQHDIRFLVGFPDINFLQILIGEIGKN